MDGCPCHQKSDFLSVALIVRNITINSKLSKFLGVAIVIVCTVMAFHAVSAQALAAAPAGTAPATTEPAAIFAVPTANPLQVMDLKEQAMTPFKYSLGLGVHFDQGEPISDLELLKELGIKWVRESEGWPTIESEPGKYAFPESFKQRLDFYKANDMGIFFILYCGNARAYPQDKFNAEAFGKYAAAVARMFKDHGVRFALTIWNEPHNFELGPALGGNWNGTPPSPWLDQYVKMVRAVVQRVHAVDPKITVLTDEDVIVNHYWFMAQGLPQDLTGFGLHPYTHDPTPPERTAFDSTVEWARPFTVVGPDRSFKSMIQKIKIHGKEKLGHEPIIWATEWGYPIGGEVDEALAAAYLVRMYVNSVAAGVAVVSWHVSQDMGDGPYGLWDNSHSKRQAFYAYKTMARQLGDYHLVKQLLGADHPASGAQAYLFNGPKDDKIIAWCVEGEVAAELTYRGKVSIFDKLDKLTENSPEGGRIQLALTGSPVYICGDVQNITTLGGPVLAAGKTKKSGMIENFSTSKTFDINNDSTLPAGKVKFSWTPVGWQSAGALIINFDFRAGGEYSQWTYSGSLEQADALLLRAKSTANTGIMVTMVDSKGNAHIFKTVLTAPQWKEIEIKLGGNNSQIQWPVKKILIGPDAEAEKVGTLSIDEVVAVR